MSAGATKILASDVDPDVPLTGRVDGGTMTIRYESTRRGRMAVDFRADDLSVIGMRQVDPEPILPSVNGPVRLRDPSNPAIAFIAPKGNASVLAITPLACVEL